MLWIKSFHLIFMVTWFAGMFYLPRLFVYHAECRDAEGDARFKVMERKLFWGIMTPGGVITVALGLWLLFEYAWTAYSHSYWLPIKMVLAAALVVYHALCGLYVRDFAAGRNRHSHVYYRWFNEVPVLFLIVMVILAVVKPF